jgi:transposase
MQVAPDLRWPGPLSVVLTSGNVNDTIMLGAALIGIRTPRRGPGRLRTRPERLLDDKDYSSAANRHILSSRAIAVSIPERADQLTNRRRQGRAGGRPYAFNPKTYHRRNVVERCFNRFKQWRGIATRYDKKAVNYRAGIILASVILWLKTCPRDTC